MFGKIADLHIHSFYSDGTMSPEEILEKAINRNIGFLAITDHDMLDGSIELVKLCENKDIQCISGVEIDAIHNGLNYHILAYGVNLNDEVFSNFIKQNRILLEKVNITLIEKMSKDYKNISLEDYLYYTYDRKLGGWKTLHYLIEKGMAKDVFEGFQLYEKYETPHRCVEFPSIKLITDYIHKAGGKAVLAHPGKVIPTTDMDIFKEDLLEVIDFGVDGIECYYPAHTEDITRICIEVCEDKNLLITCGSDCHGEFQSTEIGQMNIPIEKLNLNGLYSSSIKPAYSS